MIRFLTWLRDLLMSVVNLFAKAVVLVILLIAILLVVSLARGDGLPGNMVLALDLRDPIPDSLAGAASVLTPHRVTVMDLILALDAAGRDSRVKGVVMRLGNGALSTAQAEEIATAITRLRGHGKFVVAQATAFYGAGLGDYLAASAASEIWMQPRSDFAPSGAGGGEIFLKGLFDKINAEPQIAKRAEYKSAADMYMEKGMSAPDREQLTVLMQSVYDAAVAEMAKARKLTPEAVKAALEASPQFAEDAQKAKLIDRTGYDDEARAAALARAGAGARLVGMSQYLRAHDNDSLAPANIALVEASGEIKDGSAHGSLLGGNDGIASDDLSQAIRLAASDSAIKAIVLRVDSPGGSVSASDQILHAVTMAQAAGKPVVVSMGGVAASGGYFISMGANRIVAEPGTITGSIGVLTGKVSFGKSVGLVGVAADQVSVGKNTLMDSALSPYTPEQWALLNHQADVIYDDFTQRVSKGRKLPLAKVQEIARGRVWSGSDAKARGLVDGLGGFWTAAGMAANLGGVPAGGMTFRVYPRPRGLLQGLSDIWNGADVELGALSRVQALLDLPAMQAVVREMSALPRGGVELRSTNLPK
jgi:protease IV